MRWHLRLSKQILVKQREKQQKSNSCMYVCVDMASADNKDFYMNCFVCDNNNAGV